jgi:hypothetical protein
MIGDVKCVCSVFITIRNLAYRPDRRADEGKSPFDLQTLIPSQVAPANSSTGTSRSFYRKLRVVARQR